VQLKGQPQNKTSWKQGWREIGGKRKYYRSKWEANYARFLQMYKEQGLIKDWFHESITFWFEGIKRGTNSYKPDFKVIMNNDSVQYHEVKGYMDPKSATKLKRMKKYHPTVMMRLIDAEWFKKNNKTLKGVIKEWE